MSSRSTAPLGSGDPPTGTASHVDAAGRRSARRAWIGVALIPVSLILAFVASEVLVRVLGYDPTGSLPLWVDILAWSVTVVIVLLPSVAVMHYANQTRNLGDRRGRLPMTVGVLAGLLVIVVAVATIASTPHP
jgi:uncharacterized membrane protein